MCNSCYNSYNGYSNYSNASCGSCCNNSLWNLFGGTQRICRDCCGNIIVNQNSCSSCSCNSCCGCCCNQNGTSGSGTSSNNDNGYGCVTFCGTLANQTSSISNGYAQSNYGRSSCSRRCCNLGVNYWAKKTEKERRFFVALFTSKKVVFIFSIPLFSKNLETLFVSWIFKKISDFRYKIFLYHILCSYAWLCHNIWYNSKAR